MATEKTEMIKRLIHATLGCALLLSFCAHAGTPHEIAALTDLAGDVRSLTFAPDGKTLAVCTGVIVKIWDYSTKTEKFMLSGGGGATFSPQGDLIAYPGQDENNNDGLMIWDITETGKGKKRTFISDDNVRSPQFSPDGKTIAAAVGGKVKFWEVATGKEGEPLAKGHKSSISVIAYVNNGKGLGFGRRARTAGPVGYLRSGGAEESRRIHGSRKSADQRALDHASRQRHRDLHRRRGHPDLRCGDTEEAGRIPRHESAESRRQKCFGQSGWPLHRVGLFGYVRL